MSGRLDAWPPLPFSPYVHRTASSLPFPLAEPNVSLFSRARAGIVMGVGALGLQPGDEVLTPAYHHGSEIEALLHAGLVPRFYDATETLAPPEEEIAELIGPRTRALYLIHYLGFPQEAARWRRFCDDRGLLLLEDAAQAWLSSHLGRPLGSFGDLAVFCLYKSFGLPDGAVLLLRPAVSESPPSAGPGLQMLARRHAAWLLGRSRVLAAFGRLVERSDTVAAEKEFELGAVEGPCSSSTFLVPRFSAHDAAARRRSHYRLLLEEFELDVPEPFREIQDGTSPFAFPLATRNKRELIERLRENGIRAIDFWSVPHPALPAERFPRAAELRATTVCLPVHQELRVKDVERIAQTVRGGGRRPAYELEWLDDLEEAREDWQRLAPRTRNIFATWEWSSLWWRQFGQQRRLLTAACRRGSGARIALLPLYEWRKRPLRVLRFLGHATADELGPVCAPSDRASAARALRGALDEVGCDILLAEHLTGVDSWTSLLGGGHVVKRESYPLILADGGWEAYLATRSSHFRKKLGWQERKLGGTHELHYRLASDPDRLDADLDVLFSLHMSRWRAQTSFVLYEKFHREFAHVALEHGWLRLWFLELDGDAVAAWYGFRFAGVESHFQSGRDPSRADASLGSVLLIHTIREALGDGLHEYRFLRGGESYKYRFATDDPGLATVALARGAASRFALGGGRLVSRLRPARALVGGALAPKTSRHAGGVKETT